MSKNRHYIQATLQKKNFNKASKIFKIIFFSRNLMKHHLTRPTPKK